MEKKGDVRLARHGAREQGLARARGADEQRALGELRAYLGVLARLVQEVHYLLERLLGLVLASDVGEGLARLRLGVYLCARLAEAHRGHPALRAHALEHPAVEQDAAAVDEREGEYPGQEEVQERGVLRRYFAHELYLRLGVQQAVHKLVVREYAGLVDHLSAFPVLGEEDYLLRPVLIGHLPHEAVLHHAHELVVTHLGHLPLHELGEEQGVEQYQREQGYGVVIEYVPSGLAFFVIWVRYHVIRLSKHLITYSNPAAPVIPRAAFEQMGNFL